MTATTATMAHRPREVTRGSKRTGKQAYEKLERIVLSAQPVEGEGAKRKTPLHLSLAEFRHLRTDYERAHGRPPLCIELLFAGSAFVHLARGRKTVRADHFLAVAKQSSMWWSWGTSTRTRPSHSHLWVLHRDAQTSRPACTCRILIMHNLSRVTSRAYA